MDIELFNLASKLSISIKNNPDFLELEKLESEINQNEEIMKKAYKKDQICSKYSDLLKVYAEDSEEIVNIRRELLKAKELLYSEPLVKRYLEAYAKVRDLLKEVNTILLEDFK